MNSYKYKREAETHRNGHEKDFDAVQLGDLHLIRLRGLHQNRQNLARVELHFIKFPAQLSENTREHAKNDAIVR